jgi:membrane protease YdiL (CAAX protease family)
MSGATFRGIDWWPVFIFVPLAVILSTTWAAWASLHGLLKDPASSGIYASVAQVGVLISALAVMATLARPAFRTIGWRLGPIWVYGAVFIAVSSVIALSIVGAFAANALKLAQPAHVSPATLAISAPFLLVFTCLFSFCEEFGWRGFLLPKLLPLGIGRALVVSGLIWFLWEAPLVWFGMLDGEIGRVSMPLTLALHLIQNIAIAVAFGYLRLRFGSVYLPAFAHGLLNTIGGLSMALLIETNPIWGDFDGPVGTSIMAATGAFAWILLRRAKIKGLIHDTPTRNERG